ncbi:MAG: PqqD family protein [Bacteroidaceae bacterium]|nr:PqqD family protein [Bacteroidaceae bacterium]
MKIKDGFELMTVCDQNIVISHGKQNINFSKVITLNESASLVWNALMGKDFTAQDAANVLTSEYEIDEATALADSEKLINDWVSAGIVE